LLRYRHLTLVDRLAAIRGAAALRTLDPEDASLDGQTFGGWLRAHGQSDRTIATLWNLIALPTLNLDADAASLLGAVKVFRTGLLDESDACDIGVPRVPLQHLHGDPAERTLRGLGARVELGAVVSSIEATRAGFELATQAEPLAADAVVVAVPHQVAAKIVPAGVVDESAADALGESPIVNLHLHYDRRVLGEPLAAAIDSTVQWVFDRTGSSGVDRGQLVSVSLSGADDEVRLTRDEIVARLRPAVEQLLPAARRATLLDASVTKEPRATFRAGPGTAAFRPGARTHVPGLYLAGAWTDTGWPATMEGAVRSGVSAGRAALAGATGLARNGSRLEHAA
jgi:squalene-associated FAD-dependent desaturase